MIKTKLFGKLVICLISFLFLTIPKTVLAQNVSDGGGLHLTASPLPINLITKPGSTVSAELKIKNGGTKTEKLVVGLMKFNAYGEDGQPRLMDRAPEDDFFDWVSFSENTFEILPNEWKTITATFTIPKTAAFGYYYAVTFSRAAEATAGAGQTAIAGATATLVLVEVQVDNAKREVEVLEFMTDRSFYEFLPASFKIKLKNSGNVHVAPRGNIFIERGSQRDVAILEINETKGNLLPGSNRIFTTNWEDGFPVYKPVIKDDKVVLDKNGVAQKKLNWDFSQTHKLRFGKYTAKMLLVYDNGIRDVPIEGTLSFWVMPWRLIGVAGFILILTFVGLWSTLKKIVLKLFKRK
jgi:hypothetical protein